MRSRNTKRSNTKRSNTKRSNTKRSNTKHKQKGRFTKKKSYGGKAIDAGSYGCVFRPPLKCADSTIPYNTKYVSKLMYKDDIGKEITEMNKVKKIIEKIPDNDNYFLVSGTYTCNPAALESEDMDDFDEQCGLFTEAGITAANVNNNLNKLAILNIPDGGKTIDDYFKHILTLPKTEMYTNFIKINNALIKLLIHGLVPINQNKLNHFDVKGNNILITEDGEKARLIDWGLAGENDGSTIPREIENRSIHFNMPYSDIFFNNYIKTWLPAEFKRIKASAYFLDKKSGQAELIKIISINLLNKVLSQSKGHFKSIIKHILHDLYKVYAIDNGYNTIDYNVLSYNTVIEYIQTVILNFADENGNFNDTKYFYEIFTKNADIWGFLMCYTTVIGHGVEHESGSYIIDKDIINGVCRILIKYCFSSEFSIKPIDISELTKELESLNTVANAIVNKEKERVKAMPKLKPLVIGVKRNQPIKISSLLNDKFGISGISDISA